jgi:uncharacterized protein involved in exopolysaccharide biosynthesis
VDDAFRKIGTPVMNLDFSRIAAIVRRRKNWIIIPTALLTTISLLVALFKPDLWTATQALYVRDEGLGSVNQLGRFQSVDAMQTAQETILEVARHQTVLREALNAVGPAKPIRSRSKRSRWPSDKQVESFRKDVNVKAPYGAQFGRTEMIYLTVRGSSPERAVALTDSVCRHLIERMKRLRREKYDSIVHELTQTVDVARHQLDATVAQLQKMESDIGPDLAELRVMMNSGQGDGHLRRALTQLQAELRAAQAEYASKERERRQLAAAQDDPQILIAMPSKMLDTQPGLKRFKESLVDAQVNTARLLGLMRAEHPEVQAAMAAEEKVRRQLFAQLHTAIAGLDAELAATKQKITMMQQEHEEVEKRMQSLSQIRTHYSSLATEVDQRTQFLQQAERELAAAKANGISAAAASLIHRVDQPIPSPQPIGPSAKVIVLAGLVAGLLSGLGLIYISEPAVSTGGRRGTDPSSSGRWAADQTGNRIGDRRLGERLGRRATDWLFRSENRQPPGDGADAMPGSLTH